MMIEDLLTEEERMVRDQVRNYCAEKLMPRILKANRNETYDAEVPFLAGL